MTKDTHIAGGLAITMALAMPQGFKELAVCLTAATIGSVISDIDITTSESRRDLNKILIISVVAIVVCTILEVVFKLGIVSLLQSETDIMRILCGIGFFLFICCFGINTPHIIYAFCNLRYSIIWYCMAYFSNCNNPFCNKYAVTYIFRFFQYKKSTVLLSTEETKNCF